MDPNVDSVDNAFEMLVGPNTFAKMACMNIITTSSMMAHDYLLLTAC